MGSEQYQGLDKVIKDTLVAARGQNLGGTKEDKILALEKKLETAKLTHAEVAEIQKQLKQLRMR